MITARIHRNSDDSNGIQVQLFCLPRIGESVSMPDLNGTERDLRVIGINHLLKSPLQQSEAVFLWQIEVVIFCEPTTTLI